MIADLKTVLWKELKEIPWRRGSGLAGLLIGLVFVGIILPLQMGLRFFQAGQQSIVVIFPMMLIMAFIADSFAGERERHTLETLLASPLSDRAILFGKIIAAVLAGWALSILSLLLGLAVVNLKYGAGKFLFPVPAVAGVILFSLLAGLLVSGAGVLVSLRASTVRQAQQMLSMGTLIVFFAGILAFGSLPREWLVSFSHTSRTDAMTAILEGAAILLLIDLAILGAALARFRRSRLILD